MVIILLCISHDTCLLQQLLDAGKAEKRGASVDQPTRLLRQLLFPDSDCQVVRFCRVLFCIAVYFVTTS